MGRGPGRLESGPPSCWRSCCMPQDVGVGQLFAAQLPARSAPAEDQGTVAERRDLVGLGAGNDDRPCPRRPACARRRARRAWRSMSRPRVGSSSSSTFGSRRHPLRRARSSAGCRPTASTPAPPPRMPNCFMYGARDGVLVLEQEPAAATAARCCARPACPGSAPATPRSSGTSARPGADRVARATRRDSGLPAHLDLQVVALRPGRPPNSPRSTLVRPAPTRPARPRISPACRSNDTRPRTSSTTSGRAVGGARRRSTLMPPAPARNSTSLSRVASFGRHLGHLLPVAQADDPVGDLQDLAPGGARCRPWRGPACADRASSVEQPRRVGLGQRRGRLVEQQHLRVQRQRARDLRRAASARATATRSGVRGSMPPPTRSSAFAAPAGRARRDR